MSYYADDWLTVHLGDCLGVDERVGGKDERDSQDKARLVCS